MRIASPTTVSVGPPDGAPIAMEYGLLPKQPLMSVDRTVKLKRPGMVGVPVIAPVAESSTSPGGNAPLVIAKMYGPAPPLAVMLSL